jgi:hypothetical protein
MTGGPPQAIALYDEATAATLDSAEITAWLRSWLPRTEVARRGEFVGYWLGRLADDERGPVRERLARDLAAARVRDPSHPVEPREPLLGEMRFERGRLEADNRGPFGVVYDGLAVASILGDLLPPEERSLRRLHIILTNRLLATWSDDDLRYHLRVNICAHPALVSTSGLVEAPAKPRGFYEVQQSLGDAASDPLAYERIKHEFRGQFIDHDDERLTEAIKGPVMQAVTYPATGEAFCDDPACRLFNAHWQQELIAAQLGDGPEFCRRHADLLRRWGKSA